MNLMILVNAVVAICSFTLGHTFAEECKVHHICDLHEKLRGTSVQSKGLSIAPQLKSEHVNFTSYSQMRVDLAAPVIILGNNAYVKYIMIGSAGIISFNYVKCLPIGFEQVS